jgi:hypothetical protein
MHVELVFVVAILGALAIVVKVTSRPQRAWVQRDLHVGDLRALSGIAFRRDVRPASTIIDRLDKRGFLEMTARGSYRVTLKGWIAVLLRHTSGGLRGMMILHPRTAVQGGSEKSTAKLSGWLFTWLAKDRPGGRQAEGLGTLVAALRPHSRIYRNGNSTPNQPRHILDFWEFEKGPDFSGSPGRIRTSDRAAGGRENLKAETAIV